MAAPVALVTGASRGIGRATALGLADAGYDVAVAARTVDEGDGRMDRALELAATLVRSHALRKRRKLVEGWRPT